MPWLLLGCTYLYLGYAMWHWCCASYHACNHCSLILSSYETYENSVPRFLLLREECCYKCRKPPQFSSWFLELDVHIVFQGYQGLHIHKEAEHRLPHARGIEALWMLLLDVYMQRFPLPRRILVLILLGMREVLNTINLALSRLSEKSVFIQNEVIACDAINIEQYRYG